MLGTTRTTPGRVRIIVIAAGCALALGCTRNVPQDADSGKDHRYKGARTIELDGAEARVRDIVTYPGGDRVDWKVVALPEGQKGDLRIRLKFKPARPGMDVAFDVYDQWFHRVARAKPKRSGTRLKKRVKVKNAQGTYYIQVYAPRRMDAGRYTLSLRFSEQKAPAQAEDPALLAQIDDPPSLPGVPAAPPPPDPNQPPIGGPGTGPPGTETPTETPIDAPPPAEPLKARVIKTQASTGGVIVTLNRGKNHGVDRGWQGQVLQGSSNSGLDGGEFKIIKVTKTRSIAKIRLSIDQIKANPKVLLTPP